MKEREKEGGGKGRGGREGEFKSEASQYMHDAHQ